MKKRAKPKPLIGKEVASCGVGEGRKRKTWIRESRDLFPTFTARSAFWASGTWN